MLTDCKDTVEIKRPSDKYTEPETRERNRIERRNVKVFKNMLITDKEKWNSVEAIIRVDRERKTFDTKTKCWKNSDETSFYISTTILNAEEFCVAIRNHWGIENRNHYVRDVSMNEDKSRIRKNPHIFAKLRSFALNILRANEITNINMALFRNAMNLNKVLNLRGVF